MEVRRAELAIAISYPKYTNGVTILLKTPPKYSTFTIFYHAYVYHIYRALYDGSYTIMAWPMKTL